MFCHIFLHTFIHFSPQKVYKYLLRKKTSHLHLLYLQHLVCMLVKLTIKDGPYILLMKYNLVILGMLFNSGGGRGGRGWNMFLASLANIFNVIERLFSFKTIEFGDIKYELKGGRLIFLCTHWRCMICLPHEKVSEPPNKFSLLLPPPPVLNRSSLNKTTPVGCSSPTDCPNNSNCRHLTALLIGKIYIYIPVSRNDNKAVCEKRNNEKNYQFI